MAQTDTISFGIENDNRLTIEDLKNIEFLEEYKKYEGNVWRCYHVTGELKEEVEFKKVFDWRKLKHRNLKNGISIVYKKTGEIYSVEKYIKGKRIRVFYRGVRG